MKKKKKTFYDCYQFIRFDLKGQFCNYIQVKYVYIDRIYKFEQNTIIEWNSIKSLNVKNGEIMLTRLDHAMPAQCHHIYIRLVDFIEFIQTESDTVFENIH